VAVGSGVGGVVAVGAVVWVAVGALVVAATSVAGAVLAAVALSLAVGATGRDVAVGVVAEGAQALTARRTSSAIAVRRVLS
jgi:hypothetical protein